MDVASRREDSRKEDGRREQRVQSEKYLEKIVQLLLAALAVLIVTDIPSSPYFQPLVMQGAKTVTKEVGENKRIFLVRSH